MANYILPPFIDEHFGDIVKQIVDDLEAGYREKGFPEFYSRTLMEIWVGMFIIRLCAIRCSDEVKE